MHNRILLIEDDETIRFGVAAYLSTQKYQVFEAADCAQAEAEFRAHKPQVVIADYQLPDGTAFDLLPRLRRLDEQVPVILLTGHGSIDLAVQAIKIGAEHFLTKPVALPALLVVIERALENRRNRNNEAARVLTDERQTIDPFVGSSRLIADLRANAERVAASAERPVWIRGETGSGKGVLARWLHRNSRRANEPMIELNCAGLPRELVESELFGHEKGAFTGAVAHKVGLLEAAQGGTFFLDEIGDMDLALQPKLLKAVEDGRIRRIGDTQDLPIDAWLITATHNDLAEAVRQGRFRSDLYYRISTIHLQVPPLRERAEDIPILAQALLERLSRELGRGPLELSARAVNMLAAHPWPGNVRELRNVLERAVLFLDGCVIDAEALKFDGALSGPAGLDQLALTLEEVEQRHIQSVLQDEAGNVERAARRLGISRSSLYQKLKLLQAARAG